MIIFGFHHKRLHQWLDLLEEEGRYASFWAKIGIIFKIIWAGLRIGGVSRKQWRSRMRVCGKCVIYDKSLKRCAPWTGSQLGCHCYMPFKIAAGGKCWLRENVPGNPGGWE